MTMYSTTATLALLTFFAFEGVYAALGDTSSSKIAVYWGQNSYGHASGDFAQHDLAYYCKNSDIDVILLAFLDVVNGHGGAPEINFANSGDSCTTFTGTALLNCPTIAKDIMTCQSLGISVLLSIGGATYSEGGFTSDDAAISSARMVWKTFGPVSTDSSINRPFGEAVIDGFDFDFETTVNHMPSFANELRRLSAEEISKRFYLTAAPQCVYPDVADNPMLNGAVYFDAIWVQFYNNHCGVDHFTVDSSVQNDFNFATWDTWATTNSLNKNVKVFLAIPGGSTAAGSGYVPASTIASIVEYIVKGGYSSFGGLMVWDASQMYANDGFLASIASCLGPSSSNGHKATSTNTQDISIPTKPTTRSTVTKGALSILTGSITSTYSTVWDIEAATLSQTSSVLSSPISGPRTSTATIKSTKSMFTTMTTSTLVSSTSNWRPDACPASGKPCATAGAYTCNGSRFGICDNGNWVIETCASGLICVQDGPSIYCDYKNDHPDTNCG